MTLPSSPPSVDRLKALLRHRGGLPRLLGPRQHTIRPEQVHPTALEVVGRLAARGHFGLLVGGAVRDLLLGREPKDFDVVTTARPEQVRAIFRNARIIGRRFRLALLRYPTLTVEVSTFRGRPQRKSNGLIKRDNAFGHPRDDAFRRDFTVNALSLDPASFTLIDYVGGLTDLRAGLIRTIAPPEVSFREDPVRMLRAVRFQQRLQFTLEPEVEATLRRMVGHLAEVSRHRLAEEAQRFLTGGLARASFMEFERLGLLRPLLGVAPHGWFFAAKAQSDPLALLGPYLEALDEWAVGGQEPVPPTVALLGLLSVLGRAPFRNHLRGAALRGPREGEFLSTMRRELAGTLGAWGLLNGQVHPALQILEALRELLGRAAAPGPPTPPRALAGMREACMLAILLQRVFKLAPKFVAEAAGWRAGLADLPILDHPRPPGARKGRRRTQRPRAAPAGGRRRRPRKRTRGGSG